jgi:hypothetical protein
MAWWDFLFPAKPKPTPTPVPVPSPTSKTLPTGFYLLLPGEGSIRLSGFAPKALKNPNITGFVYRDRWYEMQPAPGKFNFSRLDKFLDELETTNQTFKLTVFTGSRAPSWLESKGVKFTSFKQSNPERPDFGQVVKLPVPYDPELLKYYADFVAKLADKYDKNPRLQTFAVGGPTRDSLEFHLWDDLEKLPGYSHDKLKEAWRTAIDSVAVRFIKTPLSIHIANPIRPNDGIAASVADYHNTYLGTRAITQHDSLSAKSSNSYNIHKIIYDLGKLNKYVGFEQISASHESRYGGSLATSLKTAINANAKYVDIYKGDLPGLITKFR